MDRKYQKGYESDLFNAMLAGIAADFRNFLATFWRAHGKLLKRIL